MLHLAICDDEKDFVQHLTGLLNQYSRETGRDMKITPYYDGIELIEKYDPTIDLIFLDIQMKLMDGLHAAERIRQMDETVGIIFLTTLTQYGLEGYKYHATNYIIKPMKYARLKSELDHFIERSQKEDTPSLVIANDTGKYDDRTLHVLQSLPALPRPHQHCSADQIPRSGHPAGHCAGNGGAALPFALCNCGRPPDVRSM